jgi:uncharacterized RDD family membrane protein YckC
MSKYKISKGRRVSSMLLDHFAMTFVAMIFAAPSIVSQSLDTVNGNHIEADLDFFKGTLGYVSLLGFAIYLCKDCVNGQSIAKRILKIQVVDNATEQPATPLKSLVRNVFCILWPVEVIITLINPSRRIGDRVADTKVIRYDSIIKRPELNFTQIALALLFSYGLMLLIKFFLHHYIN